MKKLKPEEQVEFLENKVEKLETELKKRSNIEIATKIFASVLIPLSIAIAGNFFAVAMKEAQIISEERVASQQIEITKINAKVDQAQLISNFLEALTSKDLVKRKLAVEAVLIALPSEGPKIVQIVLESDPSKEVVKFTEKTIKSKLTTLINDIFSENKQLRMSSTQELIRGWRYNDHLIPELLESVFNKIGNANGVWNAVIIFENIPSERLINYKDSLLKLEGALKKLGNRNKTIERLKRLI